MLQRFLHRCLCDLIKCDAVRFLRVQPKRRHKMPADRLTFTVRVSCQIDFIRFLRFLAKRRKNISLTADRDVLGLVVIFRIKPHLALGQIPYMTC